jgi:hypothetical protein
MIITTLTQVNAISCTKAMATYKIQLSDGQMKKENINSSNQNKITVLKPSRTATINVNPRHSQVHNVTILCHQLPHAKETITKWFTI